MIFFIKIIVILMYIALLCLPFLPIRFDFCFFKYDFKKSERYKNFPYAVAALGIFIVLMLLFPTLHRSFEWIASLNWIKRLLSHLPAEFLYTVSVFKLFLLNLISCVAFLVVKKIVYKYIVKKHYPQQTVASRKGNEKQTSSEVEKAQNKISLLDRMRELRNNSVLVFDSSKKKTAAGQISVISKSEKQASDSVKEDSGSLLAPEDETLLELLRRWYFKIIGVFYREEERYTTEKFSAYRWGVELRVFLFIVGIAYLLFAFLLFLPAFFQMKPSFVYKASIWLTNNLYLYPMAAIVFLRELCAFLSGMPKEADLPGNPRFSIFSLPREEKKTDINELKTVLLKEYKDKYHIVNLKTKTNDSSGFCVEDAAPAVKKIAQSIKAENRPLNGDYIQGINKMLQGENVLFDTSIYSGLGEYILRYLSIILSTGLRVLFICHDKKELKNAVEYLSDGLKKVTCTSRLLWRIETLEKMRAGVKPDVLMLLPEDFLDESLYADGKLFFEELSEVFVLDAERIISHNNYFCLIIAKRIEQAVRMNCTVDESNVGFCRRRVGYRFLTNGHIINVENSIQQYFNLGDDGLICVNSFNSATEAELFVWSAGNDSDVMIDNSANQVALEVCIAQISNEQGIHYLNLISDAAVYGSQVASIDCVALNRFDISDQSIGCVIVADDKYNLPNAVYHYLRFSGRKASILHIVSKPYLLREYFLSNLEEYINKYDCLSRGSNEHAEQKKTKLVILLCDAIRGISIEAFLRQIEELFGISDEERRKRVADEYVRYCMDLCLRAVCGDRFNSDAIHYRIERKNRVNQKSEFFLFLINTDDIFSNILDDTKPIRFDYINTHSSEYISVFRSAISQNFIVDQTFTHNNKSYTIKKVDIENGVLLLDDTSTSINVPDEYIQTRKYRILSADRKNSIKPRFRETNSLVTALGIELFDATIVADTVGYYEVSNTLKSINFTVQNGAVYHTLEKETRAQVRRQIETQMLRVHLEGNYPCSDRMSLLLAIVMQESFKTLYPDFHKCLSVCPVLREKEKLKEDVAARNLLDLYPEITENVIAEQFKDEQGMSFYVIEDIRNGNGISKALIEANGIVLTNLLHSIADFLLWGIENLNDNIPYLRFGYETIPEVLDVVGLEKVLHQFCQPFKRIHRAVEDSTRQTCSFCLNPVGRSDVFTLTDGRLLCPSCRETLVDSFEALEKLSEQVVDVIKKSTAVPETIPDVSISFVSTNELAERCASGVKPIPMAYCNRLTKEIFVEYGLPEVAMAACIARLLTEVWQEYNLLNDGSAVFAVQPELVEIQTVFSLFYSDYAINRRSQCILHEGFTDLLEQMSKAGTKDSFAFLLGKNGISGNVFDDSFVIDFNKDDNDNNSVDEPDDDTEHDQDDGSDSGQSFDVSDDNNKDESGDDQKGEFIDDQNDEFDDDSFASVVTERNPDKLYHYYYGKLDAQKKSCYDAVLDAMLNFLPSIEIGTFHLRKQEVLEICDFIENDHPEVFWLSNSGWRLSTDSSNTVQSLILEYCFTKREKEKYEKKLKKAVAPFLRGIKPTMSDYEVALCAHTNIAEMIDYDSIAVDEEDLLQKTKKRRPAHFFDEIRSIYGVFVNKKAVCAGYAKAYQYLLNRLGIECAYILGQCDGERHAWNLMKLEGDYYHTDVTWDDHSNTKLSQSNDHINYDYFCLTTDEIKRSRTIEKESLFPVCTAVKCNYYHRNRLYFDVFNLQSIAGKVAPLIRKGEKTISFKFKNEKLFNIAYQKLFTEGEVYSLLQLTGKSSDKISFSYNDTLYIIKIYFS